MSRRVAIALLGGVGLVLLALARSSALHPYDPQVRGERAKATRSPGGIAGRPIHPASPAREGRETDDWDALGPGERMDQAEAATASALVDGVDLDAQQRAWSTLSAARADFFVSDAGARRYLELEQMLLISVSTPADVRSTPLDSHGAVSRPASSPL